MQNTILSQNDLRVLDLKAKAKAEYKRMIAEEKYRFYVPNGKTEEFIRLVGSGDVFIALFSAANGIGKTACGVNIIAHFIFECNCKWFNYPLYKNFPFLKKGRIVSDPTTLTEKTIPELKKWFPDKRYNATKGDKHYEAKWKTDTGFEFDLMSYEQDAREFEAVDLGWAWFDEPPPEVIYKATVSRMRRGGIIFMTETPLKGSAWLYDKFITSPDRIV